MLASLSNLDHDFDESTSSLSNEELKRQIEDKLNGPCFLADTAGGLCTMALAEDVVGGNNKDISDDSTFEVSLSADDLTIEVAKLMTALASLEKLIRLAARERI